MLVRWFTEFLGGTKRQAHMLWSQEKSQTTWWDCSSRKTTQSWLAARALYREKARAVPLFPQCSPQAECQRVSPAHFCIQVWLVKTSSQVCTLAAREYERSGFPDFPLNGSSWTHIEGAPYLSHPGSSPNRGGTTRRPDGWQLSLVTRALVGSEWHFHALLSTGTH